MNKLSKIFHSLRSRLSCLGLGHLRQRLRRIRPLRPLRRLCPLDIENTLLILIAILVVSFIFLFTGTVFLFLVLCAISGSVVGLAVINVYTFFHTRLTSRLVEKSNQLKYGETWRNLYSGTFEKSDTSDTSDTSNKKQGTSLLENFDKDFKSIHTTLLYRLYRKLPVLTMIDSQALDSFTANALYLGLFLSLILLDINFVPHFSFRHMSIVASIAFINMLYSHAVMRRWIFIWPRFISDEDRNQIFDKRS